MTTISQLNRRRKNQKDRREILRVLQDNRSNILNLNIYRPVHNRRKFTKFYRKCWQILIPDRLPAQDGRRTVSKWWRTTRRSWNFGGLESARGVIRQSASVRSVITEFRLSCRSNLADRPRADRSALGEVSTHFRTADVAAVTQLFNRKYGPRRLM